jgi:hypothetical protein
MTWTANSPNATKILVDFRKLNIHAGAGYSVVLHLLWQLVAPTCDVCCESAVTTTAGEIG